jgi:RNA polymerase sigma factor (sigma-70 family)
VEAIRVLGRTGIGTAERHDLEGLYRAHATNAYRLACLLTSDNAVAEDITQEAFVRVGRKVLGFRDLEHGRAYLYRTIVNLCRGRGRRLALERTALAKSSGQPQDHLPDIVLRDEMWRALNSLPPRQRTALFLRYYLDQTEADAADVLGCSVGALKSLVSRALASLRDSEVGGRP